MKLYPWLISILLIPINLWLYSPNLAQANNANNSAGKQFSLETFAQKTSGKRQWGRPPSRTSGGSRSTCEKQLIALLPGKDMVETGECQGESLSFMTATTSPNPTIWIYIPPSLVTKPAELVILDKQQYPVSVQSIDLPQQSGISGLKLDFPLENHSEYRWQLSVTVNPQSPAQNPTIEGLITRIVPSKRFKAKLKTSSKLESAYLYAQAGFWHDTLTTLGNLHCTNSTKQATNDWSNLLDTGGLEAIASSSLVNCQSH